LLELLQDFLRASTLAQIFAWFHVMFDFLHEKEQGVRFGSTIGS
jgi:hypothetical protein